MLYDPKWEIKSDPLSKESLVAFLSSKDAAEKYDFTDPRSCAIAQWLKSNFTNIDFTTGPDSYHYGINGELVNLRRFSDIVGDSPHTFGAALERARAAAR